MSKTIVAPRQVSSDVQATTVSGTTDTLAVADQGFEKRYTNASAKVVTVPATATLGANFICAIANLGAGDLTFTPDGGVTIRNNPASVGQYKNAVIRAIGTDEYLVTHVTLTKADVGLGNVDNTSNATERAATATLTNKRVTPRIGTTASSSTPTPNADTDDEYTVTALAANATFGAPAGTPTNGQSLIIRIKDNGTARTLAFNAIYRAVGVTLPTTTVISKTIYLGMIYNSADTKWDVLGVNQEA